MSARGSPPPWRGGAASALTAALWLAQPACGAGKGDPADGAGAGTGGPAGGEDCAAAGDADADGRAGCADPDCWGAACPEDCAAAGDEDADGRTGCADPDCWGATCAEDCAAPGDEDGDGLAGCEDADCALACDEQCDDGVEGDGDGLTDCADPDCALRAPCWETLRLASDGGASLRRRRINRDGGSYQTRDLTARVMLDSLTLSDGAEPATGTPGPCVVRALSVSVGTNDWWLHNGTVGTESGRSSWLRAGPGAVIEGGCPAPTEADLRALRLRLTRGAPAPTLSGSDRMGLDLLAVARLRPDGTPSWQLGPDGLRLGGLRSDAGALSVAAWRDSAWVSTLYQWNSTQSQTARADALSPPVSTP